MIERVKAAAEPSRLTFLFLPLFLFVIEWVVRSIGKQDSQTFAGPSIAAVGMGYIFPLIRAAKAEHHPHLKAETIADLQAQGLEARPTGERKFLDLCWFALVSSMLVWVWTLYEALTFPRGVTWIFPTYDVLGAADFGWGAFMAELGWRRRV